MGPKLIFMTLACVVNNVIGGVGWLERVGRLMLRVELDVSLLSVSARLMCSWLLMVIVHYLCFGSNDSLIIMVFVMIIMMMMMLAVLMMMMIIYG